MLQDNLAHCDADFDQRLALARSPCTPVASTPAARDELSALMLLAHDLRGPLANLELLLESISAENVLGQADVASKVQRAELVARRMSLLLASVLARARTERDPLAPRLEIVDLQDLIEEAAVMNEPAARKCGIRVRVATGEPVLARVDAQLILEVFDNLITNAIKHGKRGTLVSCAARTERGAVTISIADEGEGITDEEIARLFRPFTSLGRREAGVGGSCGLGLWICRLIAERHGGRISVARRADRPGSVFSLSIPCP